MALLGISDIPLNTTGVSHLSFLSPKTYVTPRLSLCIRGRGIVTAPLQVTTGNEKMWGQSPVLPSPSHHAPPVQSLPTPALRACRRSWGR